MKNKPDGRIDAYIEKAPPFAQPILRHLREVVHEACPETQETIKWSMPHFTYADAMLCGIAAFKAHVTFGFWHQGMEEVLGAAASQEATAMGSFGRITSLTELPSDRKLIGYIRAAMKLTDSGVPGRTKGKPKPALAVPADLAAALKKNAKAAAAFEGFPPGHRREYIEWITEAKRDETRQKRLDTTVEWLAEGKSRNWKYANC